VWSYGGRKIRTDTRKEEREETDFSALNTVGDDDGAEKDTAGERGE
jgi:hypothetical protein